MTIAVISGRRYHRHMANLPSPARALTLSAINADYEKYLAYAGLQLEPARTAKSLRCGSGADEWGTQAATGAAKGPRQRERRARLLDA